ncbi:deoxyribonuclease [Listeria phage LIS04]|nr:deoxyribonuclease [Listeria phage LIS04]
MCVMKKSKLWFISAIILLIGGIYANSQYDWDEFVKSPDSKDTVQAEDAPSSSEEIVPPKTGSEDLSSSTTYAKIIEFPSKRYPETSNHIQTAISKGHPDTCTIDRPNVDERREQSLKGVPTRKGFDRDEFPMAVCAEGGTGASVMYISPSDNRGAGSWFGHQISGIPDGSVVKIIVK